MPSLKTAYASLSVRLCHATRLHTVRTLGRRLTFPGPRCGTTALAFPSTPGTRSANVADFSPFAGVRYAATRRPTLAALVAPPYDVIDEDQRAALEAADEHNAVRLILPRDASRRGRPLRPGRRDVRGAGARRACSSAIRRRGFYAYRMEFTRPARRPPPHPRRARRADAPRARASGDIVLPHERTLPKAKSDRLALLRAIRVNVDPIWGLTLGSGLTELLDGAQPLASLRRRRRRHRTSSPPSTTRARSRRSAR